jgi:hypothetical protein
MQLNEHAVRAYNEKAMGLLQQLTAEPAQPPVTGHSSFQPDVHISGTFTDEDIKDLRMSRRDREGNEVSKTFYHEGKTIELAGEGYQVLKRVAEGMRKAPDLRDAVSVTVLIDLIFEWIEARYKDATSLSMTEFVLHQASQRIREFEVWIPIAATRVQSQFEFGNMQIRAITREMLDEWEAGDRHAHPEASAAHDVFFERWRKALLGLAAATLRVRAEPTRAYELASAEAERTLAVLRCLSFYSCFPFTVSNSVPLGEESTKHFKYIVTHEGRIVFWSSGFKDTLYDEWRIDNADLELMKSYGMDRFSALLKEKKPTSFQRDLLHALQLYGRSSTLRDPADKLTYIFAALEALLSVDRTQSLDDWADRLIMFVDKAAAGRKDALRTIRTMFARRLSFVHSEHTRQDLENLEKFMIIAWTFFMNVVGNANTFKSRPDFIRAIDNSILSGGLA